MARKVNPVPKGYRTATPVLVVQNAAAAVEFYTAAFGAVEQTRQVADDGITLLRVELKMGNSIIHICDEMPAFGILSPVSLGGTSNAIMLYLSGVDEAWDRAIEGASTVIAPLEDAYWGERTGKLVDPFGHVWILSKKTEALTQAEVQKRFAALAAALAPDEAPVVAEENVIDISEGLAQQGAEEAIAA